MDQWLKVHDWEDWENNEIVVGEELDWEVH